MNSFKYILVGVALAAFIAACGSRPASYGTGSVRGKIRTASYGTGLAPRSYGTGSYGTGDWRSHRPHHHTHLKGV